MSDDFNETPQQETSIETEEESFAELFESYSAGMKDDLQVGEKISARIISIGTDSVFLDTGTKVDGVVEKKELLDESGELPFNEGDEIELFVVAMDEHEIRLSQAISGVGGLEMLQQAFDNAIPVEGKVNGTCKGGFNVEVLHRRAFCPISQIDFQRVETPDDFVGQTYEFLIIQFEERGKNIVVSRRKLLEKAMQKDQEAFFSHLKIGDTLSGRITRIMPYGAFVELTPGVEGMVHVSEISWSRVENVQETVTVNQTVQVKVLAVTEDDAKKRRKISLSMKQIDGDPWLTVSEKVEVGEKISGIVTRCMNFGVFVEIAPGIEGLVHISEMSYTKRVVNPADVVSTGETISVLIKEIDASARRISLSMKDAEGDPWLDVSDRFSVGQVVPGVLEKKEAFGCFITLAPGITGLLPKSKISGAEASATIDRLKVGDAITVTVIEIHPTQRKITLAPEMADTETSWQEYTRPREPEAMGDLAEKLRQAMEAKNR